MKSEELLATAYVERHPEDAARVLERMGASACAAAIDELPSSALATIMSRSTPTFAASCLGRIPAERAGEILAQVELALAARVLRAMGDEQGPALLAALPDGTREALDRLLRFPEGTAGSVMEPRILAVPGDITVAEAVQRLGEQAHHLHSYVYVVDRKGVLLGVAAVRELMLARGERPVADSVKWAEARLSCYANTHEILVHPGWQDYHALPVVDREGLLLGAVRYATYRRLERETGGHTEARDLLLTGMALAELYWVTLARAFGGLRSGRISEGSTEGVRS